MNTTNKQAVYRIAIEGMTCGHCVQTVTKALASIQGVEVRSVAVGSARIFAPDGLTVAKAVTAIEDAGYTAAAQEAAGTADRGSPSRTNCCGGSIPGGQQKECCG